MILKIGKGKKAIPVFEIFNDGGWYGILHIPTKGDLGFRYEYRSMARAIANEWLVGIGDKLVGLFNENKALLDEFVKTIPRRYIRYASYYRFSRLKEPLSVTDWEVLYYDLLNKSPRMHEAKLTQELYTSDKTLVYFSEE